jgi:hypothetical protein
MVVSDLGIALKVLTYIGQTFVNTMFASQHDSNHHFNGTVGEREFSKSCLSGKLQTLSECSWKRSA